MNPPNWTPLSNPLQEDEVKLELTWKADERTLAALERQAKLNGFDNPAAYMLDIISFRLATDEADTVVKDDGRLCFECEVDPRGFWLA
jgi:hypothetical protein